MGQSFVGPTRAAPDATETRFNLPPPRDRMRRNPEAADLKGTQTGRAKMCLRDEQGGPGRREQPRRRPQHPRRPCSARERSATNGEAAPKKWKKAMRSNSFFARKTKHGGKRRRGRRNPSRLNGWDEARTAGPRNVNPWPHTACLRGPAEFDAFRRPNARIKILERK